MEQSHLAERLRESSETLVIWDVGLGAAANAMAAIRCYEAAAVTGAIRPMRLISFENDLDSLRLALLHNDAFPYLRHGGPPAILGEGAWQSKTHAGLSWSLVRGDYPRTMADAPSPPDLIFYDMFSGKTSAEAWTLEAFRSLFAACKGRAVELFTYSCSTSVRGLLLAAGFHVARGRRMGAKDETTIALTPAASRDGREILGSAWLERWNRSQAKFPEELSVAEHESFARIIRAHPQFQAAGALTNSATSG